MRRKRYLVKKESKRKINRVEEEKRRRKGRKEGGKEGKKEGNGGRKGK